MAPVSLDALILCAGRGERLRPLTDVCPKPLLPLAGVTLADRALAACEALSPVRRMANAHHLPDQILSWAEARSLDHVQVEPVLLDTGGALACLLHEGELGSDHLLVHNGDLVHSIDLSVPWRTHLERGADATLVVLDRPEVNPNVAVSDGRFRGVFGHPRGPIASPQLEARTFSGIAFYRKSALGGDPHRPWSVKELWHDLLEAGKTVLAWQAPQGSHWADLGHPAEFLRELRRELASRELRCWIDPTAVVGEGARVGDDCAVEFGAHLGAESRLESGILFPGASLEAGRTLEGILRNPGGDLPAGRT